jgi:hypothetical protein
MAALVFKRVSAVDQMKISKRRLKLSHKHTVKLERSINNVNTVSDVIRLIISFPSSRKLGKRGFGGAKGSLSTVVCSCTPAFLVLAPLKVMARLIFLGGLDIA